MSTDGDPFAQPGIREVVHETRDLGDANSRLRVAVARHFGLPVADVMALTHLQVHGAMSQRQLAEGLGISTSAVTVMLDRLEPLGLMTRVPDPHDRRRTLVHVYTAAADPLGVYGAVARPFLRLSEEDRRHAIRLLPQLREILEESVAAVEALPPVTGARVPPTPAPEG